MTEVPIHFHGSLVCQGIKEGASKCLVRLDPEPVAKG